MDDDDASKPGRPRSERARRAVLESTQALLTDKGLPGLTVDDIASRAGVSKNTIYRWWPNKAAVLMDAFTAATAAKLAAPIDGTATQRFRGQVHRVAQLMNEPEARRPFIALVAASQHDRELAVALRDRFVAERRASATILLDQITREHPDRNKLEPDIVIDLVYGALYYRLLITGERLDAPYVDRLLDAALGPVVEHRSTRQLRPTSLQRSQERENVHGMVQQRQETSLIVFVGPTGDHNDRGAAGASILGGELSRRLNLTPSVIGVSKPATSEPWHIALPAALPGLSELQREHRIIIEGGGVPVAALPRCAASLATLPTIAELHPDAVVVWFDAHADLNTPVNSTTGYLGGLVLSAAIGWWDSGLGAGLHPERVVLGGTRDLDPPEQNLIDTGTIKLAAGPSLHALLDQYIGDRPVYFHLDCDVLEPGTVPTDYQVPDGLNLEDLNVVSQRLSQNRVVGIEVAEFEAAIDPSDETNYARLLLDALEPLLATVDVVSRSSEKR